LGNVSISEVPGKRRGKRLRRPNAQKMNNREKDGGNREKEVAEPGSERVVCRDNKV